MNASEPAGSGHPSALRLLARIEAHGFDAPDDPLGFETRLADDNGWTLGYARIVVAEYRRFLVLTQLAKEPVSPPQDVDQAWHLHLTRTAHYAAFCDAMFGRFLHHDPAGPGDGEVRRHRDMYEYTRTVYRRGFGEAPPEAVWPRPGHPLPPEPVPAPRWAVPAALQPGRRLGWACVGIALLLCMVPGALRLMAPLWGMSVETFLVEAVIVAALAAWGVTRTKETVRATHRRDTLDPYEVAWFGGGAPRMAMTGIAALVERGVLLQPAEADRVGLPRHALAVDRGATAPPRHPVEAACLRAATDAGLRFADACTSAKYLADAFERRLAAAGLVAERGTMPLARARVLAAFTLWLAVCFGRCRVAFMEYGHVGEAIVLVALAAANVMLLLRLARRPTRVAARAQETMKRLGAKFRQASAPSAAAKAAPPIAGEALALGVALVGTAAFAGDLRFAGLDDQFGALGLPARQLARKKALEESDGASGFDGSGFGFGSAFGGLFGGSCGSPGAAGCGSGGDSDRGAASWDGGGSVDIGGGSSDGGGGSSCSGGSSCGSSCSGGSSCGGGGSSCGGGGSD